MKLPAEVLETLGGRYDRLWVDWVCGVRADTEPRSVTTGSVRPDDAKRDRAGVGAWIAAWIAFEAVHPDVVVTWVPLVTDAGRQDVPKALRVRDGADLAALLGRADHWQRATQWCRALAAEWDGPTVRSVLRSAVRRSTDEIAPVLAVARWLRENPRSGLMPRQLPVEGIQTKWVATRYGLLAPLVRSDAPTEDVLDRRRISEPSDGTTVEDQKDAARLDVLGLKARPSYVRLAVLDPALRGRVGGLRHLAVAVDELSSLAWRPAHVVVIENLETAVTLPDIDGTVVIHSLGHNLEPLRDLGWARDAERVTYWGDVDAEGLAILDRVRAMGYEVTSVLMDVETVEANLRFAGSEERAPRHPELSHLTEAEQQLYTALVEDRWRPWFRLEQERLPLELGAAALRAAAADC